MELRGGGLGSDAGLRLLMVYPKSPGLEPCTYETVSNVSLLAEEKLGSASRKVAVIRGLALATGILALASPLIGLAYYLTRGREGGPGAPLPPGMPPRTGEKPWQVNLLYTGTTSRLGSEAVIATILDMAGRGMLSFEKRGDRLVLKLEKTGGGLDDYEEKVVAFLRSISQDGEIVLEKGFIDKRFAALLRSPGFAGLVKSLLKPPDSARRIVAEAIEKPRGLWYPVLPLILFGLTAVVLGIMTNLRFSASASLIAVLTGALAYVILAGAPPYVYGRWRPGYLERYIAWNRFRAEAADLVKRLGPRGASSYWYPVLAYAVALGTGDRVADALRSLGLEEAILLADAFKHMDRGLRPAYGRIGGGGGGGGFGGGGAGVR